MIISAADLCRTRLCQARLCEDDAMTGWALCSRCDAKRLAGTPIELHIIPPPLPDTLRCTGCNTWKLDNEFPTKPAGQRSSGGRDSARRGRYCYCHDCCADPIAVQIRQWKDARKNQARRQKSA